MTTIDAKIYNKNIQILTDTGSEIALLNSKITSELKLEQLTIKVPNIILVGANEKKVCEVKKGIISKTVFLQNQYPINLIISEIMNYDMVLENDELNTQGVIII